MAIGVWNIVLGIAAIAYGASGHVTFFSNDPRVLMAFGAIFAALGVYQLTRALRSR